MNGLNSLPSGKFFCFFCRLLIFFQNQLFRKSLPGITSECQTVWLQIRPASLLGPDLGPNCFQKFLADDTSKLDLKDCDMDTKSLMPVMMLSSAYKHCKQFGPR